MDLTEGQQEAIDATLTAFAAACNDALEVGREAGTTSNVKIHDRCYYDLREAHDLPANLAVRAIARAAGILKVKERRHSTVRPTSIDYDARTFSFKEGSTDGADWSISVSTVEGRQKPIALDIGDYQRDFLEGRKPKSAVLFKKCVNGEWTYYAGIHIDVEEPPPGEAFDLDEEHGWVGVDFGIVQLATLDDGTSFSGEEVDQVRSRYLRTRSSLQAKDTRNARKLSGA